MYPRQAHRSTDPFDRLPTEVLYCIFDYLPIRTLHYQMKLVCKRFCTLLTADKYYKCRLIKRHLRSGIRYPFLEWHGLSPAVVIPFRQGWEVSWEDMAVRLDKREYYWNMQSIIDHRIYGIPHNACVDTVCLLYDAKLCVSGGRDKSLCLWETDEVPTPEPSRPVAVIPEAHDAWIWDIAQNEEDVFFTCGWDHYVKQWTVGPSSLDLVQTFSLNRPSMCLTSSWGMLAVGTSSGRVVLLDPRISSIHHSHAINVHTGVITGIDIWNNHILSVGEDKKMAVTDVRTLHTLLHQSIPMKNCPKSSSVHRGLWHIGDVKGNIHVFNCPANYNQVMHIKAETDRSVNSISASLEGLIVGTSDGVEVIIPTWPKTVLNQFSCSGEVTSVDFKNNVIAAGSSHSRKPVHILRPILCFLRD